MAKRNTWEVWSYWTKKIYHGNNFKGWPRTEMRKYYDQKYTPLAAFELATRRRRKQAPNVEINAKAGV